MKPPFFFIDGYDVSYFDDIQSVRNYIETTDVIWNEYKVYDITGHLLIASVDAGLILLSDSPDQADYSTELRKVLSFNLLCLGKLTDVPDDITITQLMQELRRYQTN